MKLKDTGLLPIFQYVHDRKFKVYLKDSIDEIDLTEWLKENGWVKLPPYIDGGEVKSFEQYWREFGLVRLSDVELDVERYIRAFAHTHEAKYIDGKLTGECNKCGLDIRDKIHREAKPFKEKK